ncbi:MAG: 3-dehydroquinate synthase, partial [Alcanivorax sp.]|nr:3-dehydroquinate synthase [Alcanivorax sp.]
SQRHGWISRTDCQRVDALIGKAGLPTAVPSGLSAERMRTLMQGDKKTAAGRVRLVLFRALGDALLSADYDRALLMQTLQHYCHD